jgi:hypothetical protein
MNKENPPDSLNAADSHRVKVECEGGEKALVLLNKSQKENSIWIKAI